MKEIIIKLHSILNMIKGFTAGYGSDTFGDGKMAFDYEGKRYFLKIEEVPDPSESLSEDLRKIRYWN